MGYHFLITGLSDVRRELPEEAAELVQEAEEMAALAEELGDDEEDDLLEEPDEDDDPPLTLDIQIMYRDPLPGAEAVLADLRKTLPVLLEVELEEEGPGQVVEISFSVALNPAYAMAELEQVLLNLFGFLESRLEPYGERVDEVAFAHTAL